MGNRGSFPGVKRPEREADHTPPSSAGVNSLNTPSWRGSQLKNTGTTLHLPYKNNCTRGIAHNKRSATM
jgi:hypothetical protein